MGMKIYKARQLETLQSSGAILQHTEHIERQCEEEESGKQKGERAYVWNISLHLLPFQPAPPPPECDEPQTHVDGKAQ